MLWTGNAQPLRALNYFKNPNVIFFPPVEVFKFGGREKLDLKAIPIFSLDSGTPNLNFQNHASFFSNLILSNYKSPVNNGLDERKLCCRL